MMEQKIPTLTTDRLTLQPFSPDHATALHHIMQNPAVLQYFPSTKTPSLEQVEKLVAGQIKHWEQHNLGWWALELRSDSTFIGWCGLQYLPETDEIEVGYLLGHDFWGKGYATEAGRASLQFAFDILDLTKIVGIVHPENLASQHVLEKLGLKWVEAKEYFGMHCFRYLINQSQYQAISVRDTP